MMCPNCDGIVTKKCVQVLGEKRLMKIECINCGFTKHQIEVYPLT